MHFFHEWEEPLLFFLYVVLHVFGQYGEIGAVHRVGGLELVELRGELVDRLVLDFGFVQQVFHFRRVRLRTRCGVEDLFLQHRVDLELETRGLDQLAHGFFVLTVDFVEILEELLDAPMILHQHLGGGALAGAGRFWHGSPFTCSTLS